jgi:hypothetical protein
MSGDAKPRSILSELKKPLLQPNPGASQALEDKLLGTSGTAPALAPEPPPMPRKAKEPTVPVTFHLPVKLRDRIKVSAQAQQRTMLEIAVEALEAHLDRHPVTETDLRRLLGL